MERYQADEHAWDGWLFTLAVGAMQARSLEVLIVVFLFFGILIVAGSVLAGIIWFIQHIGVYLGKVFVNRAQAGPQLARVIPVMFVTFALAWLFSFLFYDRGMIPWAIHINILAFSWMFFALASVWMGTLEERGSPQLAGIPITTHIRNALPWGKKQPTNKP